MNETDSAKPKKRSGWIGFFSACLLLLLIALPIGFYWWHSDADLVDIRNKATANNIPVTWAEFGLKKSEPDRIARWKRIVTLTSKLPTYQSLGIPSNPKCVLFSPIPKEMSEHHATLDELTWTEFLNELDLLGDQPLHFHDTYSYSTMQPEFIGYKEIVRRLQERIALATPTEVARLCTIQLALCRSFPVTNVVVHQFRTSMISIALNSLTRHLYFLKSSHSRLADAVSRTTFSLPNDYINCLIGEFQYGLILCKQRAVPGGDNINWYFPLTLRLGRHEFLSQQIDLVSNMRDQGLADNLAWEYKRITSFEAKYKGFLTPELLLSDYLLINYAYTLKMTYETQLHGRLIAAELSSQPWPQDIFDPTGAPLRPVLRDGKIIGAYSVGSNGIDDGGDKKLDRYFPLYGPLELPVAPTTP